MAYAALLSLIHVLQRTLKYDRSYLLPGEEQQIESHLKKVVYLQDFLDNFPRENIDSIEGLERKIRYAACHTEDITESCIANRVFEESCIADRVFGESASHRGDIFKASVHKVLKLMKKSASRLGDIFKAPFHEDLKLIEESSSCSGDEFETLFDEEIASHCGDIFTTSFHEIAKLIEEVDSIETRAGKIEDDSGINEDLERNISLPVGSLRPDSWGQSTTVGLDDALEEIKGRLVGGSSKLDVVSIVGMGGIGKTTLAYKVYIDKYIEYHFHIRGWLNVSQEYSVREILLGLLDSMKIQYGAREKKDIDQLGGFLYKNLKGRRYFFVLDDLWDIEAWDSVKRYFPEDKTGSRILLTTRLENVANYISSGSPPHHVRFLNDEESWNLFCQKLIGEGCPNNVLIKIGKKIVEKCRGLPLAVVVIGGLLSKASKTPHYWRIIAQNLSSEITSNDEQCSKILSLSYKHLPHHLKGCFLYMGMFPEDFEIKVKDLIRLWVAEGILKAECSKTLEDVGEEYFLDLVQRSLILVEKKGSNGKIKTCRIHDLLRDLCVREAEKENFFEVKKMSLRYIHGGIRDCGPRVSIHVEKNSLSFSGRVQFYHATQRTFRLRIPKRGQISGPSSIEVCINSRPLKVLHMDGIHPRPRMKASMNLRYIYCSNNFPQNFAASMNKFRNLQTIVSLDDYGCIELPPEIWKMTQLRHVMWNASAHLPDPPLSEIKGEENSIVVLENLQTLSRIYNFRLTEEILERIPNLQKLAINYDSIEKLCWEKYCINNLVRLTKLESLKCCLPYTFPRFLVHITFPSSLKKLTLEGVELHPEESTILGKVTNLKALKLKNCAFNGLEWKPNEGEFLKLNFLLLSGIHLKHWRADSIHFPRLERLVISFGMLDEIPGGFGEISTLQFIELHGCSESIVESAKEIKETQLDWGNDDFELHIKKY